MHHQNLPKNQQCVDDLLLPVRHMRHGIVHDVRGIPVPGYHAGVGNHKRDRRCVVVHQIRPVSNGLLGLL